MRCAVAPFATASLLFLAACQQTADARETTVLAPVPAVAAQETGKRAVAIFAGGCFWGIEGVFSHVRGVTSAVSGYHGGSARTANYDSVSSGRTGHAEAVRVVYDPSKVTYGQLLRVFFSVAADPTTLNYQGPDHGNQYRTALVPLNADQRRIARAYLAQLGKSGLWNDPIVTRLENYAKFYPAEKYHQDFMKANPRHPYIVRWDAPKVAALKARFPALYTQRFQPN
ncbi:MAG: peptide-methionine (S)-S-oxide reductase MsrA [Novosphingobium sp.]